MANFSQHQAAECTTSPRPKAVHSSIGISLKKVGLMQAKIEEFVGHMSDLLRIERDVELEFTQEELNATPMLDDDSKPPKPVEYLVSHGQAQQEQCDTICNLNVISSSTGEGIIFGCFFFFSLYVQTVFDYFDRLNEKFFPAVSNHHFCRVGRPAFGSVQS